jgi:branched-chain amino acid transport system permease protein
MRKEVVRSAVRIGAIGGVVVLYSAVVGMVGQLTQLFIVGSKLTLAWVLIGAPPVFAGYLCGRTRVVAGESVSPDPATSIVAGTVAGFLAGVVPVAGIGIVNLIGVDSVRAILPSVSPDLLATLTFHSSTTTGALMLLVSFAILGTAGGALRALPARWRRAVVVGISTAISMGALQRVIPPAFDKLHVPRGWLYSGVTLGLTMMGAVVVFLVGSGASYALAGRRVADLLRPPERTPEDDGPGPFDGKMDPRRVIAIGLWLLIAVVILVLPSVVGPVVSRTLGTVGIFLLLGLGLNIVVGFAGLLDLGYVAFFSVGAFLTAILTGGQRNTFKGLAPPAFGAHLTFYEALPIVIVVAALIGMLIGAPVLRLRGDYLAIVTLGFGEIARVIFGSTWAQGLFGGSAGLTGITKAPIGSFQFDSAEHFYYMALAFCLIAVFVSSRLQESRIGRAWNAMREDEQVAGAMGISTTKYKLLAFAIGGAIGATGGGIFAVSIGSLQIASFQILVSITALAIVILGGLGSIPGVVVGALVLIGLPNFLTEFQSYQLLIYGAVLVGIMLLRPQGLVPNVRRTRELQNEEIAQDEWAKALLDDEAAEVAAEPAGGVTA